VVDEVLEMMELGPGLERTEPAAVTDGPRDEAGAGPADGQLLGRGDTECMSRLRCRGIPRRRGAKLARRCCCCAYRGETMAY